MPKLKKPAYLERPPIDWLWAAVLERKAVYGMDLETMAKYCGISYPQMRQYIRKSPWEWPRPVRERLCSVFGIKINLGPEYIKLIEDATWQSMS